MKEKVAEAYARLAKDYERHVDTGSGFNAYYERPTMMGLIPQDLSELAVLDAGCAAGWYTEQFIARGAAVTAVDLSPEMVEACKRRVGEGAEVLRCDLTEPLPWQDETFDLIVSSLTLHYIDDWAPTFREFRRILKFGGKLVYSVHHPFMDFKHFNRTDYFAHELLVDKWNKKEAGLVEVPFYRRPLHEIINATSQHFTLRQIVEPKPIKPLQENSETKWWIERWFGHLMTNPHFLIVEADKANCWTSS